MTMQSKSEYTQEADNQPGLCYYCEKPMTLGGDGSNGHPPDQATRDHYVAKSKSGRKTVPSCRRCNGIKADDLNAYEFKWAVGQLLKNPDINAAWHRNIKGLDRILFRMIRIEIWKERQLRKHNTYREQRINKETAAVLALIAKLKL